MCIRDRTPPGIYCQDSIEKGKEENNEKSTVSQKDSLFTGIWFEAWRYQNEATPIVALLQNIKAHFSTSEKLKQQAGKLSSIAFLGALTVFDNVIKAASGLSGFDKLQKIGEKYEKDTLGQLLTTDLINDYLTKAVNLLVNEQDNTQSGKNKLVIFIDDLDRCEPETAYRLLEGLKLYLNIPNCIIVLAIDPAQIESSLLAKFAANNNQNPHSRFYAVEYMEKLCQDEFRLPVPTPEQRSEFLLSELRSLSTAENYLNEQPIDDLKSAITPFDCLPANPRRLKMLVNRIANFLNHTDKSQLAALNDLALDANTRDELYILSVLAVAALAVSYRRLYERLEMNHSFISELIEFSDSTDDHSDEYKNPHSVFYEFNRLQTKTSGRVEHPSDLGVFRLRCLFFEGRGSLMEKYDLKGTQFGEILHQVIAQYKTPASTSEAKSSNDNKHD